MTKNLKITTLLLAMLSLILPISAFAAKGAPAAPKPALIRMSLEEAVILQQLLQQIELATQEVAPFLEITTPLGQVIETEKETTDKDKKVLLRLPLEAAGNLLLFTQRANIPAMGAKQVNAILNKVQNSLPKGSSKKMDQSSKKEPVSLMLTSIEANFVQNMLEQIELNIAEIDPFLEIYLPLEKNNATNIRLEQTKNVVLKLPEFAPRNLLLFLERIRLVGQQAKIAASVIQKLAKIMTAQQAEKVEAAAEAIENK